MATRMSSTKAIAAGVAGTLVAFLTRLEAAVDVGGVSDKEWVAVALATVVGGAAAFGLTWFAPANRPVPPGQ